MDSSQQVGPAVRGHARGAKVKITVERTTRGPLVRIWNDGKSLHPAKESTQRVGQCVYCKRAGVQDGLCRGGTTNCETRVWLESRKLRGET